MTARLTSDTILRVVLDTTAPRAGLAADILAGATGIAPADAQARLAQAPADLGHLPKPQALRLADMLRLFGLRVRTEAVDARHRPATFEASLQWMRPEDRAAPLGTLAAHLDRAPDAVASALEGPGGLVLTGLDRAALCQWNVRLKALPGLRLLVSDPEAARYDLLPLPGAAADPALARHLARLGLGRCPLTGAIAAGLDRATRDHVARRFPQAAVIAVNRDFQRFDLVLTGATGLTLADLNGFLRTRNCTEPGQGAANGVAPPRRIECGLGRADALAFQSDYAAIGIDTRLRLVWPEAARPS